MDTGVDRPCDAIQKAKQFYAMANGCATMRALATRASGLTVGRE